MRERRSKPGVQVSPLTKADFNNKVPAVPKSLFAHNTQQTAAQSVHSQNTAAKVRGGQGGGRAAIYPPHCHPAAARSAPASA